MRAFWCHVWYGIWKPVRCPYCQRRSARLGISYSECYQVLHGKKPWQDADVPVARQCPDCGFPGPHARYLDPDAGEMVIECGGCYHEFIVEVSPP